jgi:pimeloyl-ACP methyl ester carboxylesterase
MARQLTEQGEKVAHLHLIDPPMWEVSWFRVVWPLIDKVGETLKWDLRKKTYYFEDYIVPLARWLREPPRNKFTKVRRRLGLLSETAGEVEPPEFDKELLTTLDYAIYCHAYRLYALKSTTVPTTLYFPDQTGPSPYSWMNRAGKKFPNLAVEIVPGDHHTCITKYTSTLGDKMKKSLGWT